MEHEILQQKLGCHIARFSPIVPVENRNNTDADLLYPFSPEEGDADVKCADGAVLLGGAAAVVGGDVTAGRRRVS